VVSIVAFGQADWREAIAAYTKGAFASGLCLAVEQEAVLDSCYTVDIAGNFVVVCMIHLLMP
jgi:hypothetical protein